MPKEDIKIPDYLSRLMEGCSSYTKVANQYWIALAFFSLVTLYPALKDQSFEMPFGLWHYPPPDFYTLAFVIDSILVVCFGSAFSQANRARKLVRRAVDKIKDDYIFEGPIYIDDLVDVALYPALNRLAPIAQALQGKRQFLPEARTVSARLRIVTFWLYFTMKVLALIVLYGLPGYAICRSFYYSRYSNHPPGFVLTGFMCILALLAGIILIALAKEDILYAWGVRGKIMPAKNDKGEQ